MQKYIGIFILMTLITYLVSVLFPPALVFTTLFAWAVPLIMWRNHGKSSLRQGLALVGVGAAAHLAAASKGYFPGWGAILSCNLPLLAMFVAVAFLSLTNSKNGDNELPKGTFAAFSTAVGTHLLGAVINLSVIFVFGDRMQKEGKLSREQMIVLARSFTAAAWWSPFFIATGVALTYAPEMIWKKTMLPGVLMGLVAIGYTLAEVCVYRKNEFSGYPIRFESLFLPFFLAGLVVVIHQIWHDFNILNLICIIAPVGAFLFMRERPRGAVIQDFVQNRILSVVSQFTLFLAAGVFSSGIKSLLHVYPALLNLEGMQFSPLLFSLVLALMLIVGIFGVHPLVSISIVSPLLLPLAPDHSQLAFMFLCSWAIATGSSPLSGIGLALTSRYQASPRLIIQANYHYVILMWLVASGLNVLLLN